MSTLRVIEWAIYLSALLIAAARFDGRDYWFVAVVALACYIAGIISEKADREKERAA